MNTFILTLTTLLALVMPAQAQPVAFGGPPTAGAAGSYQIARTLRLGGTGGMGLSDP